MAITVPQLHQMKRDGKKIVGIALYECQAARIADRAGVDIVSLGDSCGMNLFGQEHGEEVTLDEMLVLAKGIRRVVKNAFFSCDMPFGSYQTGERDAVCSALRYVKEAGADCVKVEVTADTAGVVAAIARAGIPVFAQFGLTPMTSAHVGGWESGASLAIEQAVDTARTLEAAGASLLDFTHGGEATGPVTQAVRIPVLGGIGNDGSCDGQIRTLFRMAGLGASALDDGLARYANVAQILLDALTAYSGDIRAGQLPVGSR